MPVVRIALVLAVAAVGLLGFQLSGATAAGEQTIVLTAPVAATDGFPNGRYLYLPFDVPAGTKRVAVKVTKDDRGSARVGAGLFDERGPSYQGGGFRGIYGEERGEFFVEAGEASQAFSPGRINPGRWTVIVPIFRTLEAFTVTATVTLTSGEQGQEAQPGAELGVIEDKPGWYRGDLHVHTNESSDAFASQKAFEPREYGLRAREAGLDWVSLTDHNVTSQNRNLKRDHEASGTLVLGGEEMTNWFHGHSTVTGLEPGDHIDWRQRPDFRELGPNEVRIQRYIDEVRRRPVYSSVAHPYGATLAWQFFPESQSTPEAAKAKLPDGLEVWTGPFQPDDQTSIEQWDELLRRGIRIFANGGSDVHGFNRGDGFALAEPTTVTYADQLSKSGVVSALKRGRSFVTRRSDGVELYLSGTGRDGQRQPVGGTLYGGATDAARLSVLVRRGQGGRLVVFRDGQEVQVTPISQPEQTVTFDQTIGRGGYVRVELRRDPALSPAGSPISSRLDMEAFTNPLFLVSGPIPPGTQPEDAPPPPEPGPRRRPETGAGCEGGGSGTGGCQTGNRPPAPPKDGRPMPMSPEQCRGRSTLQAAAVRPRGRRLAFDLGLRPGARATVDVFRVASGRRIPGDRRVVRFTGRSRSFAWSGRGRRVRDGDYVVRFAVRGAPDSARRFALRRVRGRFRSAAAFDLAEPCGALTRFRATRPVFGGADDRALELSYRLGTGGGRARVELLRGLRVVRRLPEAAVVAGTTRRVRIAARGLPRGSYRVRIAVRQGEPVTVRTITVRRL